MNNNASMTDVQRAIWLAWIEADRAISHLVAEKPELEKPEEASDSLRQFHRDCLFDWREKWNQAIGFRDGLYKAGILAKVPNFKDD